MASVERPTSTQAVPPNATVRTIEGEQYACWVDRSGKAVKAVILPSGKCRRVFNGKWFGVYRDGSGKRKKTPIFSDRSTAMAAALELERKGKAVKEGRESADRPAGKILLLDCVDEYTTSQRASGTGDKWSARVGSYLRSLIARHRLTTPAAVDCEKLANDLEKDRRAGPPKGQKGHGEPYSIRTRNKWVVCLKGFGTWLRTTRRAAHNPFDGLSQANAEKDRRRVRRALPEASFAALVTAARNSADVVQGLNGTDRAIMYTIAAFTGLRAGALLQLLPEAFTWAGGQVIAVYSSARLQKGKGAHGIGITPDIQATIGAWLRTRPPGQPIFQGNKHLRTAEMLRHDLEAAGVPYRDAAGEVFDFHSLRVQTGYFMRIGGVPFVAAVEILDHSDPKLTAKIYSKFGGELGAEMAKLPVPRGITDPSLGSSIGSNGVESGESQGKLVNKRTGGEKKKPHES